MRNNINSPEQLEGDAQQQSVEDRDIVQSPSPSRDDISLLNRKEKK